MPIETTMLLGCFLAKSERVLLGGMFTAQISSQQNPNFKPRNPPPPHKS